jgi:hypothetical protein
MITEEELNIYERDTLGPLRARGTIVQVSNKFQTDKNFRPYVWGKIRIHRTKRIHPILIYHIYADTTVDIVVRPLNENSEYYVTIGEPRENLLPSYRTAWLFKQVKEWVNKGE